MDGSHRKPNVFRIASKISIVVLQNYGISHVLETEDAFQKQKRGQKAPCWGGMEII